MTVRDPKIASSSATSVHQPRTLAEAATEELHRMILSGQLPAGSTLRLAELADALEMSHMPVREALRRLESLGLVEIVPHKGARVRELSRADFEDTHQTRLDLEAIAIGQAASRITADQVTQARGALERHEQALAQGDLDGAREAHTDFHFILYKASGSVWLSRAIQPVWENAERYRFVNPGAASRNSQAYAEHLSLLEACARGDEAGAQASLRVHLENSATRILAQLP
ncbi:GntR family transcriptional regulator [Phycicoccus ginsengisoli]